MTGGNPVVSMEGRTPPPQLDFYRHTDGDRHRRSLRHANCPIATKRLTLWAPEWAPGASESRESPVTTAKVPKRHAES